MRLTADLENFRKHIWQFLTNFSDISKQSKNKDNLYIVSFKLLLKWQKLSEYKH